MVEGKFRKAMTLIAAFVLCSMQQGFAQDDHDHNRKVGRPVTDMTPQMYRDVEKFLGPGPAPDTCGTRRLSLHDFVTMRLQLPDDIFGQDIGKGRKLYVGHMPHNYTDVAAFITGSDGQVRAVAAVFCEWKKTKDPAKTRTSHAGVYVRDDAMKDEDIASLKAWGELYRKLNNDPAGLSPQIHLVAAKRQ